MGWPCGARLRPIDRAAMRPMYNYPTEISLDIVIKYMFAEDILELQDPHGGGMCSTARLVAVTGQSRVLRHSGPIASVP